MTDQAQHAVVAHLTALPGTVVDTIVPGALAADGVTPVPEIAWHDTFVYYTATGRPPVMPFITVITKNYPDDELSLLDRPGSFRVNCNVGGDEFHRLIGYPPGEHAHRAGEWNYAASGTVLPHPLYAAQGWVSVVDPPAVDEVSELVRVAYQRVSRRR